MNTIHREIEILIVEDNPADVLLTQTAFEEFKVKNHSSVARDGVDALSFLRKEGMYVNAPRPDIILLDLNMPKKNGMAVLEEIKEDPKLKKIPVIILTCSSNEKDILDSYNLHANAYLSKPLDFDSFFNMMVSFEGFWMSFAKLPIER